MSTIPYQLKHHTEQHIQVRKDFFDICAYKKDEYNTGTRKSGKTKRDEPNQECMAKILRLIETLTHNRREGWYATVASRMSKKKNQAMPREPQWQIELSYEVISNLLYNTYGESTIRNSIAALIRRGFIERHQAKKNDTPKYTLVVKAVQKALNEAEMVRLKALQVLNSTPENEQGVNSTPEDVKTTPEGANLTPEDVKTTPNNKGGNKVDQIDGKTGNALHIWIRRDIVQLTKEFQMEPYLENSLQDATACYQLALERNMPLNQLREMIRVIKENAIHSTPDDYAQFNCTCALQYFYVALEYNISQYQSEKHKDVM